MHNRIKLTELDQYIAYFQNLQVQHKELDAFYSITLHEVENGLRSDAKLKGRVLFLDRPEGIIFHNNSENPLDKITGAITITEQLKKLDDYSAMREISARCKKIGIQLFARVYDDFVNDRIIDFNPATIRHFTALPLPTLDNRMGYRFEFTVTDKAALDLDTTKWTDLDV